MRPRWTAVTDRVLRLWPSPVRLDPVLDRLACGSGLGEVGVQGDRGLLVRRGRRRGREGLRGHLPAEGAGGRALVADAQVPAVAAVIEGEQAREGHLGAAGTAAIVGHVLLQPVVGELLPHPA